LKTFKQRNMRHLSSVEKEFVLTLHESEKTLLKIKFLYWHWWFHGERFHSTRFFTLEKGAFL